MLTVLRALRVVSDLWLRVRFLCFLSRLLLFSTLPSLIRFEFFVFDTGSVSLGSYLRILGEVGGEKPLKTRSSTFALGPGSSLQVQFLTISVGPVSGICASVAGAEQDGPLGWDIHIPSAP